MRLARKTRCDSASRDGRAWTQPRGLCVPAPSSPNSLEAAVLMAAADTVARKRFRNEAMLLGQIGIEIAACPGKCKFCAFGQGHTSFAASRLPMDDILKSRPGLRGGWRPLRPFPHDHARLRPGARPFGRRGRAEGYPRPKPDCGQPGGFRRWAGEGAPRGRRQRRLSRLPPSRGIRTRRSIPSSGSGRFGQSRTRDWTSTPAASRLARSTRPKNSSSKSSWGSSSAAFSMRRCAASSSPAPLWLARGQITERRLAQVTAVVALAVLGCPETQNIAVHEPNLLGLAAGANVVYAETGANPRDTEADTSAHRGLDMAACRKMLYEAGFTSLRRGDGATIGLDLDRIQRMGSVERLRGA